MQRQSISYTFSFDLRFLPLKNLKWPNPAIECTETLSSFAILSLHAETKHLKTILKDLHFHFPLVLNIWFTGLDEYQNNLIYPPLPWLLILCSTFSCWWSPKYDEESIQSIFTRINKMVKTLKQMFLPRKYCRRWQVTKPNCQNWLACKTHFVW